MNVRVLSERCHGIIKQIFDSLHCESVLKVCAGYSEKSM